jgi:hypothetical protein
MSAVPLSLPYLKITQKFGVQLNSQGAPINCLAQLPST